MGDHKYEYNLELDKMHKYYIVKGLFKIIEEKAEDIKRLCADGRISGQVCDNETEAMYLDLNEIQGARDTLVLLKNLKGADNIE